MASVPMLRTVRRTTEGQPFNGGRTRAPEIHTAVLPRPLTPRATALRTEGLPRTWRRLNGLDGYSGGMSPRMTLLEGVRLSPHRRRATALRLIGGTAEMIVIITMDVASPRPAAVLQEEVHLEEVAAVPPRPGRPSAGCG